MPQAARELGAGVVLNFTHHGQYDGAFASIARNGFPLHMVVYPYMLAEDAPLRERIRAMMTLGAISIGWMVFTEQVPDRSELSDIVCDLAAEFVQAAP